MNEGRTPGGVTNVCLLLPVETVEPAQEERAEVVRTRARDSLHACHTTLRDSERVGAEYELGSSCCELGQASDREIFMVEVGVVQ